MHIELTDHLRCPRDHPEAFLVLLPEHMNGRLVLSGHLGCPVCGWNTDFDDGIPIMGDAPIAVGAPPFDAESALALVGITGPGGWIGLVGRAGALAPDIANLLDDVGIVAVNPPAVVVPTEQVSVIRSPRWPVKTHALRGVIIGAESGQDVAAAVGSVLPGLRAVGEGVPPPASSGDVLVAQADDVWVIKRG